MFKRTRFHLRRLARRTLNDLHKAGHPLPERSALAAALAAYVYTELPRLILTHAPGEPKAGKYDRWKRLDGDGAVLRVAASAARYALRKWDADYIEEMQRRGAVGGSRPKPSRCSWTEADLDALARLKGMTVAEQAVELERSPRTVERMRKALRERDAASAPVVPQEDFLLTRNSVERPVLVGGNASDSADAKQPVTSWIDSWDSEAERAKDEARAYEVDLFADIAL